jgi:hypothetical protein
VEDFLESLRQTPGPAQSELINCVLRACGCNDSVDADEVVDYDGVVDALDNFTEGLKQVRNLLVTELRVINSPRTGKLSCLSTHIQATSVQEVPKIPLRVH